MSPSRLSSSISVPAAFALRFADNKKIPVLKVIKEALGLGLLDAKQFVEAVPKAVKEEIEKDEAEKLKKQLEEAGGTVELK